MRALGPAASAHEAWLLALAACASIPDGRIQHLVLSITRPSPVADPALSAALNELLVPAHHGVATVANTLYPSDLYADPGFSWSPSLNLESVALLDQAAADLYESYELMLPMLLQAERGNNQGTYFSRMITWPGTSSGGHNQLATRIEQLRDKRRSGKNTFNASDVVIEGFGDLHDLGGVEVYKVDDRRTMGFPCLVHLDFSLLRGRLSLLAVYRHWHLIRKGYGNLLGLAGLQAFLAQQTGCEVGELVLHGTVANAEFDAFNKTPVRALLDRLTLDEGLAVPVPV